MLFDIPTLINWLISGLIGLIFGIISAWTAYRYQRKRDDIAWEREKDKLERQFAHDKELIEIQFQQRIIELERQLQNQNDSQLRAHLTEGLDNPSKTIETLSRAKVVFDQRNQKVGYQYNAAGNIDFSSVQSNESLLNELKKLRAEFDKAIEMGVFEKDVAVDVSYKLDKALFEAEEPKPNKSRVEECLNEVKTLIEGITNATGLVTALAQSTELVRKLF